MCSKILSKIILPNQGLTNVTYIYIYIYHFIVKVLFGWELEKWGIENGGGWKRFSFPSCVFGWDNGKFFLFYWEEKWK